MSILSSQHHSFDIRIAAKYGVDCAILIHHFQHWVRVNKKLGQNFKEGRTWTYQTRKFICAQFPYWTEDQVRDILDFLTTGKGRQGRERKNKTCKPILLKKNFNKFKFDQTVWYAFVDEELFIGDSNNFYVGSNDPMESVKCPNPDGQMTQPIPDIKTTYSKIHIKRGRECAREKGSASPPPPPPVVKYQYGKFIVLKENEMDQLRKEFGDAAVERAVLNMNDYLESNGKSGYKDYNSALRKWIREDLEKRGKKCTKKNYQTTSTNVNSTSSDKNLQERPSLKLISLANILDY